MIIAIPSKGRPETMTSQNVISHSHVFVPELEADAYSAYGRKNVVPVPQRVKGITKTRNWILDWCSKQGEKWVVMIDDDAKHVGYVELLASSAKHHKLDEETIVREFRKLFETTEDLKYRAWGCATVSATRAVYPWKPFIFHSYITGSCMGIVNDGRTRFDESFPVKEDYELCLRLIKEDGGVLCARYFYWENQHWTTPGGCRDYRTAEMEEKAIFRLMDKYPGMIRRVSRGGSVYSIHLDF